MSRVRFTRTLFAAALLALPLQALPHPEESLIEKYDRWAGSHENARELVTGLRHDAKIELSRGGKRTSFTPATGEMGWGNVDHALALAKASLADRGIPNPTPEQIKAALNGGTITTKSGERVRLDGVLKLRASGMGWGQIAHRLDFKLGDLKRPDQPGFHRAKLERSHRPEKLERPQRPERPERHSHRR